MNRNYYDAFKDVIVEVKNAQKKIRQNSADQNLNFLGLLK